MTLIASVELETGGLINLPAEKVIGLPFQLEITKRRDNEFDSRFSTKCVCKVRSHSLECLTSWGCSGRN